MHGIIEALTQLNIWSVTLRIALSLAFGGCIGLERGFHGRAAGLRTHILVCLGATVAALVGVYSVEYLGYNGDPMRVSAQVVSGVGFLGVGTILIRDRSHITGLTTAAGLWATACLGLAIGIGFYYAAILAFLVLMLTVGILVHLEKKAKSKNFYTCYIELTEVSLVKDFCNEIKPFAESVDIIPAKSGICTHVGIEIQTDTNAQYELLMKMTEENEHVMISLPIKH